MKAQRHSMPVASSVATEKGETVSIYVDHNHPLLQLKRALPWEALCEVMTRHWRRAGKNTDGRPGLAWDVTLYVPLVVLMLEEPQGTRHGSVSGRECRGAGVHWAPGRYQSSDSRPFQYRPGLNGPWQGGGGRGQRLDAA